MFSLALWILMFLAEFNRILGKEGTQFFFLAQGTTADAWLGLLEHQNLSGEKNGSKPDSSHFNWLLKSLTYYWRGRIHEDHHILKI